MPEIPQVQQELLPPFLPFENFEPRPQSVTLLASIPMREYRLHSRIHSQTFMTARKSLELAHWPYRAITEALLVTQREASSYRAANQQLIENTQTILALGCDMAHRINEYAESERARIGCAQQKAVMTSFDMAIAAIRELGGALIDAQIRALDMLRPKP